MSLCTICTGSSERKEEAGDLQKGGGHSVFFLLDCAAPFSVPVKILSCRCLQRWPDSRTQNQANDVFPIFFWHRVCLCVLCTLYNFTIQSRWIGRYRNFHLRTKGVIFLVALHVRSVFCCSTRPCVYTVHSTVYVYCIEYSVLTSLCCMALSFCQSGCSAVLCYGIRWLEE